MFSLVPRMIFGSVCDITPEFLRSKGIEALFMDFDNTIVPYTNDVPTEEVNAWLSMMKESGVTLCVVSNTKRGRAIQFCKQRGIDCVTHSKKPFQKGIREALSRHDVNANRVALVGDQIYTDVLGANCGNLCSILVRPIHLHNIWLKLRHVAELPFIAIGKRRIRRESVAKI